MGTGPYSLSPTVAKCAANKEVDTAFSCSPPHPASPAHAYSRAISVGVRPLASISDASAWAIRARVVRVLGPKWRAFVQGVASWRSATNAVLLGTWLRRANKVCSARSSSKHVPDGSGSGERSRGAAAGAAGATSRVVDWGVIAGISRLGQAN